MPRVLRIATVMMSLYSCATPAITIRKSILDKSVYTDYTCNYAVIRPRADLARIYKSYDSYSAIVGRLKAGQPIYVCDEAPGWDNVSFAGSCSETYINGLPKQTTRECKSGWIRDEDIEIVSG
jgi:hypothetical protein